MKKNVILISLIVVLATSFYFAFIQYRKAFKIQNSGFAFTSNKIIEKLYINDLPEKESQIDFISVKENEQVYKRGNKYYIGSDNKEELKMEYPIISVDVTQVTNMNDKMILIDDNFQTSKSYENAILADGVLYNKQSYDRVDNTNYILLNIQDNVFLNSTKFKIKDSNIPLNSIIYFMENEVRYYYVENKIFKYSRIQGINETDIITYLNKKMTYKDFLTNLGIILKEENIEEPIPLPNIIKPDNIVVNVEEEIEEVQYVKPEVTAEVISTNVYSIKLNLNINDSARRIDTNPTFEIKYDGKTFMRKAFYTSGDFEISGLLPDTEFELTGYFTYRDESDKLLKKTFINTTLKTKDTSSLEPIKLTYLNNNLYSNKIELNQILFNNDSKDEVLKGIKNIDLKINEDSFPLSNIDVQKLRSLHSVDYTSPSTLKSNTVYKSEFIITDIAGNILKVENSKLDLKTIKEKPSALITVTSTDLTIFKSNIDIINDDNVSIDNVVYVITDSENKIIKKDKLTGSELIVDNLDINTIYNISIYADYDLEDGNGIQKSVLLKSDKVSTKPLSTLGFVRFNMQEKTITQHEASYNLTINNASTDPKLLEILDKIYITVSLKDTDEVVKVIEITDEGLLNLKYNLPYSLEIQDLYSNTEYKLSYSTDVKQGSKIYNINGLSNIKEFRTLKKAASVEIINRFTNQSLIDFDVRVSDVDHSIESDRVMLYVRNPAGTLIAYKNIKVNDDYVQLTFNKLDKEIIYSFTYSVEEYNEGFTNATYEQDKVLLSENIETSVGIYGNIEIDSLLKEITSENLFDIENNKRWKKDGSSTIDSKNIDIDKKIIKLSAKNGYATYSYYLPEGKSKLLKIAFKARHTSDSNLQNVYLSNGGGSNKQIQLNGLTTDWEEFKILLTLNANSYLGFYINELSNNNTITTVEIKDLVVELGSDVTSSNIGDSFYDSKYIFSNTMMLSGSEDMPTVSGTGTMQGNADNGYAKITDLSTNESKIYSYTGDYQTFVTDGSKNYKIELWGAAGGDSKGAKNMKVGSHAGRGGYTSGEIYLTSGTTLYIYVGQKGTYGGGKNPFGGPLGGWNGGGYGGNSASGSGGGATDIRLVSGKWDNYESLKTRIMVAGAGGGADNGGGTFGGSDDGRGGHGGGLTAQGAFMNGVESKEFGGSQYMNGSAGSLGKGSDVTTNTDTGGGGGGYYGGGATNYGNGGAGGGSSYISGHRGCISLSAVNSIRFDYKEYSEKATYLATLYTSIYDTKDELSKKEFYIQIYRNGEIENSYQYDMTESTSTEKMLLAYHLKKNSSYEIRLCVKIRDRFYQINSAYFTTDEEIRVIKSISDFFAIHTTGKYLVGEDLDFRESGSSIGSWFSGKIDFQGHKVLMDTTSSPNSLISNISPDAYLTNMDVHYYLNNVNPRSNFYGLFYDFRGHVTNLNITVEESTDVANVNFCLMAYVNRGVIENFVINNKAGFSTQRFSSLAMMHNYGTLKNGYVYGENINASYPTTSPTESKRVGALAGYAGENSKIENVFSLVGIDTVNPDATENYDIDNRVGSIVGEHNRGILRNIYSNTSGKNRVYTKDASLGIYGNVTASNIFYVSDNIYNPVYSLKVAKLALKDKDFQNIINETNAFNIDDYVPYGYYPHVIWPDCMPNQEYISLPSIDDADLIDITNVKSTKVEGSTTLATLMVNNPNAEEITGVGIKDIRKVEIVSQETKDNKTILTIRLLDPIKFISKYYVKSITAKSAYGKEYSRTYLDNERVLLVDMYRQINNEQEWLNIKTYPTENFILNTDLDFNNMPYTKFQISNVQGIVNGNGHTIRNLEITSGQGLINELRGKLINLNVENIKRTKNNSHDRNGIVGQAYTSSLIDNVHVKDEVIYSYNRMGGLVGYADGAVIKNSSVTNVTTLTLDNLVDIKVGGLIAEGYNVTIQNCYVQGAIFDLTTAKVVYASGGIAGYLGNGTISNAYATGEIYTNSQETGGIVGRNNSYISNVYSNVDIVSHSDYIGGIAGNAQNTNIGNSFSVGSIYSYLSSQYVKRIAGNISIANNNYAWINQHINGKTQATSDGEELLTKEQLSDRLTYDEVIKFGTDFNYDNLEDGTLPKLYYTDRQELLPNQVDNKLHSYGFEVTSIKTYKTISNVSVLITIDNPDNYEVKNIVVDNMATEIKKNITRDGVTNIEVLLTPERAFDSYRLSKIIYTKDDQDITYNTEVKIDAQFYKDLEKFEDWQKISNSYAENYRLVADIDFDGKTNINYNVLFNRLEGTGDQKRVLKNINFEVVGNDQSLINSINSNINNIEFNNITITSKSTSNVSRNGLIGYIFGIFKNVDFKNITLNMDKSSYVGVVSFDRTTDLRDVNLDHITAKGRDYTSGFIAKSVDKAITNVNISNANVYGNGSYVGSLIGNGDYYWTTSVFHLSGTNLTVVGNGSYVGGIFGYGGGNYVDVVNANVTGYGNYVGGVAGQYHSGNGTYVNIKDSIIHGSGNNIGGIAGYSYNLNYSYVDNTQVYGDKNTSSYVGGIVGTGGYTTYYCGIKNSKVISLGSYVGGIRGRLDYATAHSNYVLDTEVKGANYVGGIAGIHSSVTNTIARNMTNAKVTATGTGAGGLLGYAVNTNTDDASNKIYIYNNIVNSTVTAANLAGGLVGRMDKAPFPGHMYNNIVSANIITTDESAIPSIVVGSTDYYASGIPGIKVYNGSTLNGNLVSNIGGLSQDNYINYDWLKSQTNYTNLGFSTSYFKFDKLTEDKFPYLINQVSTQYGYFSLPSKTTSQAMNSFSLARMTFNSSNFHLLPEFDIYPSSINSFNIEFNNIDPLTTITVNGDISKVQTKVFTYNYGYNIDLTIKVSDGVNEQVYKYTTDDIKNKIFADGNKYYLIKDNKLVTNNKPIEGNILNIFNGQVLLDDNSIINIDTLDKQENIDTRFYRVMNIKPMFTFDYNNMVVNTYSNYSTINNEEINTQILIKNNNINMIQGGNDSYKKFIVIDNYNNKDYLVILNKNGKLYNLKDKISLPSNLYNKDIKFMTNNLYRDTNLIGIIYNNGGTIIFDYRNGKLVYSDYKNKDNLLDYFLNSFSNSTSKLESEVEDSYNDSTNLIDKLRKTSIEEVLTNEKPKENKNYIQVYNGVKKSYDVYDVTSLSAKQNKVEQLKSVNDKINSMASLSNFYNTTSNKETKSIFNSLVIFIAILSGILYSVIILGRNIKKSSIS